MSSLPCPIIVAAASCQDVVIRWQTIAPVDRYIVQRIPDMNHNHNQWTTLVNGNVLELVDRQVQFAQEYTYRVQAVRGLSSSSFVNYTIAMNNSLCSPPSITQICGSEKPLSASEAWNGLFNTCISIVSGFIILYLLIRCKITDVENTQTRYDRLRRIRKTTLEQSQNQSSPRSFVSTPSELSTQTSSSSSSSSSLESSSHRQSTELLLPSGASLRQSIRIECSSHPQVSCLPTSFAVNTHRSCDQCQKKFGLFRHRHVCERCERVSLCRKCVKSDTIRQSMVEWSNGSQLQREPIICSSCLNDCKYNMTDQLPEQSDRRKSL